MPSRFEPCGLTQMQAQRYGTLPIAHRTGGLADTIADGETGFLFSDLSAEGLFGACRRAFEAFDDNAVLVAGFYTFTRMVDGKPVPAPSRFTMLVTKRGGEWCIAHHHSSPHVLPKN